MRLIFYTFAEWQSVEKMKKSDSQKYACLFAGGK